LGAPPHPWELPPPDQPLAPGAVHVWRADLETVPEQLTQLLSPDERERAARFAHERDGRLWGRSRALLRELLGRYLQVDGGSLRFAAGAHGKPALPADPPASPGLSESGPPDRPRLEFNLSHSAAIALYGFTKAGPLGVDVELTRHSIDVIALAARTFGPDEAERLRRVKSERREQEFRRAWVRHEAALKCLGTGIGAAPAAEAGGRSPWIAELEMGTRAAAAVALTAAPSELRCWEWRAA
jgi:4'-phosphopantetheinyl transferase